MKGVDGGMDKMGELKNKIIIKMYELITSTLSENMIELHPVFFTTFKEAVKETVKYIREGAEMQVIQQSLDFFRETDGPSDGFTPEEIEELFLDYEMKMPIPLNLFTSREDMVYMKKFYQYLFLNGIDFSFKIRFTGNSLSVDKSKSFDEDEEIFSIRVFEVPEDEILVGELREEIETLKAIITHKTYKPGNIGSIKAQERFEKFL